MASTYGTYLGELYDELYPGHVRAMVLDGVVDPGLSITAYNEQRAEALEGDLKDFFSWCDGSPLGAPCHQELPQGAEQAYHQLLARLADGYRPDAEVPPLDGEAEQVTLGVAEDAVLALLPSPPAWTALAQALEEALGGYGGSLASTAYSEIGLTADGLLSNIEAANTAILCADRPYPSSMTAYEHLA